MSITCQYDQLQYPLFLGDVTQQISVEAQLHLPESLPKIGMIIGGDFQAGLPTFSLSDNKVVVSGKVYPQLIYIAELPEQHKTKYQQYADSDEDNQHEEQAQVELPQEYEASWHSEGGVNYEEHIEVPGLKPEMQVQGEVTALNGVFEKNGSDQIIFRGVIEVLVRLVYHQSAEIISEINVQAPEKVNLVKDQITVELLMDTKRVTLPIQTKLILPNLKPGVARILKVLAQPHGFNQEAVRGRLNVKGMLDVSIVYIGCDDDGNPTEVFANDWSSDNGSAIPFETHLDIDNNEGEILLLPKVNVSDITIESGIPHELQCLMNLEFEVKLSRLYKKEVVVDTIAGADELLDTQKYLLNLEEFTGEVTGEVSMEQQIELPNNFSGMERILACYGKPREVMFEASEGKVLIEGRMDLWLLYITQGAAARKLQVAVWDKTVNNGLPLTGTMEFPAIKSGTILRTDMMIDSLKAEIIDERKLKLNVSLNVRAIARTPRAIFLMKDCAIVTPIDQSTRPSMLFYVVQQEDTLWKIARRYETTVTTLLKSNQLASAENIEVGQKLLIPKKIINL